MSNEAKINPVPKKREDSVQDYVNYFERVVKANGWSDAQAAVLFPGLLEVGTTCLDELEGDTLKSFEAIKKALTSSELSREVHVQQFKNLELKSGESVEEYVRRCRRVVAECYPAFAKANKAQLVRDMFVHGLPRHLQTAVFNQVNAKLEEAVQAAILAESVRKTMAASSKGKTESKSWKKEEPGRKRKEGSAVVCYNCHEAGHYKSDCPKGPGSSSQGGKREVKNVLGSGSDRPTIVATVNGRQTTFLVDTGSSASILPNSEFPAKKKPSKQKFRAANGKPVRMVGRLDCLLDFDSWTAQHCFEVGEVSEPLLGTDFLKKHKLQIDTETMSVRRREVEILSRLDELRSPDDSDSAEEMTIISLVNGGEMPEGQVMAREDDLASERSSQSPFVDVEQRKFLERWDHLFQGLGHVDQISHRIETGDAKPISLPSHRIPIHLRAKAKEMINKLRNEDVIERSQSEWKFPVVLVKKPDSEDLRVAIDYRKLNLVSRKDAFPMPRVDECLEKVGGAKVFSVIDCYSGYYMVDVAAEHREKTAFGFDGELWQFKRMPFGLASAPQTFCRLMRKIMDGVPHTSVYLDEVIVFSADEEEHKDDLERVFKIIERAGLRLNRKKSAFFQKEVVFLGFLLSGREIRPAERKVRAVREFPEPRDVKAVKRFLGLCGYYRSSIADFSILAAPLHALLKKGSRFQWTEERQRAFVKLKEALCEHAVRNLPDPERPFIVKTDASQQGIGAILLQEHDDGRRVIEFASHRFTDTEKRYPVIEQEAYAIIFAVNRWRHFLLGGHFTLETDHRPLVWLQSKKELLGKLGRWSLRLAEFDFDVKHIPGKHHEDVDALSRAPVNAVQAVDREDLQKLQEEDEELAKLREAGKIEFETKDGLTFAKLDTGPALFLPRKIRKTTWERFHQELGHSGPKAVVDVAKRRIFWPGMRDDVRRWSGQCQECEVKKDFLPQGDWAPMQITQDHCLAPLEKWSLDVIGPWPETETGEKYIFVIMDQFSKWVEAKAVPRTGAEPLKNWLRSVFARFGVPRDLLMDRGSDMESKELNNFCSMMGIRQVFTTAYHHQSNPVERFHRSLINLIKLKIQREDQKDWMDCLEPALFAYRVRRHQSLNASPFEVLYGLPPRLPLDAEYGKRLDPPTQDHGTVRKTARKTMEKTAARRKIEYDRRKRVRVPDFQVGQLVYLKRQQVKRGQNPKLSSRWIGPFRLSEQVSPVNWKIEGRDQTSKIVHSNLMKLCSDQSLEMDIIRKRGRPKKVAD